MGRAISTLVDTAAEQARHAAHVAGEESGRLGGSVLEHASDLAHETRKRASDVAEALSPSAMPIAAVRATAKRRRRARRRARRAERTRSRWPVFALLGITAIVVIVAVRRRRSDRTAATSGPAPDAFGAAVEQERETMGGDGHGDRRPVPTPGA